VREEENIKEKFIAFAKNHPGKSLGIANLVHAIITTLVLGFPVVFSTIGFGFCMSMSIGYFVGGRDEHSIDRKVAVAIWLIIYLSITGYGWYRFFTGNPWMR